MGKTIIPPSLKNICLGIFFHWTPPLVGDFSLPQQLLCFWKASHLLLIPSWKDADQKLLYFLKTTQRFWIYWSKVCCILAYPEQTYKNIFLIFMKHHKKRHYVYGLTFLHHDVWNLVSYILNILIRDQCPQIFCFSNVTT